MSAAAKFSEKGQSVALTSPSSTSSSSTEMTKTVCFRAICKSHQSYWFAVNISFEAEEELESKRKGRPRRRRLDGPLLWTSSSPLRWRDLCSWEILKEDCCDRAVNQQPVAVQDTIYWWSDRYGSDGYESLGGCPYIYAYDFSEMKLFQGPLKGLEHDTVISDSRSNLLHMGGECFCLLWCHGLTKTQYHCTQLQVSKQAQGVLNARVLSCQSFLAPGKTSLFQAQMLGISLHEDNRQDEASASLEVVSNNGRKLQDVTNNQAILV